MNHFAPTARVGALVDPPSPIIHGVIEEQFNACWVESVGALDVFDSVDHHVLCVTFANFEIDYDSVFDDFGRHGAPIVER